MEKYLVRKIVAIRERYDYDTALEILVNKKANKKDKLKLLAYTTAVMPVTLLRFIIWLITFLPHQIFVHVDKKLF